MTVQELLVVVLRRWYILVGVLVVTACVGMLFARDDGLFVTRTAVTFEASDPGPWETDGSRETGVISLAIAVSQQVGVGSDAAAYAASDAPYYGAGIRQGVRVSVPDSGGQWQASYTRAAIIIDAVSPDRAWVERQQAEKIQAVDAAAAALQVGIPASARIDVDVEPLSTAIQQVGPSRLGQILGFTALAAVGLLIGSAAAVWGDRRAVARRIRVTRPERRRVGGKEVVR
ncbi:hypothetical protein LQ938_03250 [Microbacterium sp. cx-55]|uniref:hypothetical protein n=1 Tax=unclassified Microbacterium TaxID=2609290 RepID=UPI001CBFF714|nr:MULTISPECIES: hypothetical protein [unclassified Microbacterium]MBZ4486906.1 hypothetical protein [Microbacterium sp. cx-55]MCC4908026.1 hypothetical protein [Microbacterium sp. cx-59]UGB35829.1 hypothetical protein LQ938_03250 [Microbacterium sp. cx-55]